MKSFGTVERVDLKAEENSVCEDNNVSHRLAYFTTAKTLWHGWQAHAVFIVYNYSFRSDSSYLGTVPELQTDLSFKLPGITSILTTKLLLKTTLNVPQ